MVVMISESFTREEQKSFWADFRMAGSTVKPPVVLSSRSQLLIWVRPIWSFVAVSGVGVVE